MNLRPSMNNRRYPVFGSYHTSSVERRTIEIQSPLLQILIA